MMHKAGKNVGARVLLVIGFLAASLSYSCWLAERTVLDASQTGGLARALLKTEAVQRNLTDQAVKQLDVEMPNARGNPQVRTAVMAALRDPRVIAAFADALGTIHGVLLGHHQDHVTMNGRALSSAIHDSLTEQNPQLAGQLAKQPPLDIELNGKDLPNFGNTRGNADNIMTVAAMLAVVLICLSLFKAHDRGSVSRFGRRVAYLAVVPLLLFAVVPRVLGSLSGAGPEIVGTALRVYAGRVVPSAIVFAGLGITIAISAFAVPKHRAVEEFPHLPQDAPAPQPAFAPFPSPAAPQPPAQEPLYM
jgi:hypothetical protein